MNSSYSATVPHTRLCVNGVHDLQYCAAGVDRWCGPVEVLTGSLSATCRVSISSCDKI